MAAAQQFSRAGRIFGKSLCQLVGIEAGESAQPVGGVEIHHQHVDDAVAARLQLKAALELERGSQQSRQRRRLAECAGDGDRIAMVRQQYVERCAKPHDASAHVERDDGEGNDHVVGPGIGRRTRFRQGVHELKLTLIKG